MSTSQEKQQWLKELVVAIATIVVLYQMIVYFGKLSKMPPDGADLTVQQQLLFHEARSKGVDKALTILVGLFGTLAGYYVGRVPAERAAARAEDRADEKTEEAAKEGQDADYATALLAQALPALQGADAQAQSAHLAAQIQQLLERRGRA